MVMCAMFTTPWLMVKQLVKNESVPPFDVLVVPFGAGITYKPINPKDETPTQQFGTKMLRGLLMGYSHNAGRREWLAW